MTRPATQYAILFSDTAAAATAPPPCACEGSPRLVCCGIGRGREGAAFTLVRFELVLVTSGEAATARYPQVKPLQPGNLR